MEILLILTLFALKHFVVDFPLQVAYQWQNKGTYGHLGGIIHAGLHACGTLLILYFFAPFDIAVQLALLDGFIHYHIDWAKMNINKYYGWGANTHEEFWWLLGFDQLLHSLTYLGIVFLLIKG